MHSCEHCTEAGLTSFNVVPYPTPSASHDSLVRALSGRLVLGQALQTLCPSSTLHWQLILHLCSGFWIQNCSKIAARAGCPTCAGGNWAFSLCASPNSFPNFRFCMLFSCGLSTGLFFYGVSEPIYHYTGKYLHHLYQIWLHFGGLIGVCWCVIGLLLLLTQLTDTKRSNLKPNHQI